MSIMNEDFLSGQIASKKLSNIYFVFGNDPYLKQYYSDKIASLGCTGDPFFNLQKFESDCNLQDVYDAVNQFPMMADSKCVVLYDYDFTKCEKEDFDKLCKIVSEVEKGCVLLLRYEYVNIDTKKDARVKKLIDIIEKNNGVAVGLNHRTRQKLIRMLVTGAKRRSLLLGEREAAFMLDTIGEDISTLKNELEKLCCYCKNGSITREDIENVCIKSVEASVYSYVDNIIAGNVSGALKILDKMFFLRIEPFIILASVSSCYVDMFKVMMADKAGKSKDEIVKDFGYRNKDFLINNARKNLRRVDFSKLDSSFECLVKTDGLLKSFGGDPRRLLEQLTVNLTDIIWG